MRTYLAGTGESYDLEIALLTLAVFFAAIALITWGVPWFRNRLHLRREARRLRELEAGQDTGPQDDGPQDDLTNLHSVSNTPGM